MFSVFVSSAAFWIVTTCVAIHLIHLTNARRCFVEQKTRPWCFCKSDTILLILVENNYVRICYTVVLLLDIFCVMVLLQTIYDVWRGNIDDVSGNINNDLLILGAALENWKLKLEMGCIGLHSSRSVRVPWWPLATTESPNNRHRSMGIGPRTMEEGGLV